MPMTRRDKFVLFSRLGWRGKRWYFRYQANNGETVFTSEAYNSAVSAYNGIEACRKCHDAVVLPGSKKAV